ncbi:hypothetical protein Vretifemale_13337 [Volvox reticuliferus]|nr:hypothetical protein Vretifemale_13337 [Volvox reticuliferus]
MDERIDQVLNEGSPAVKTSGPKSPPPQPPNPTVIKMLHDRHEAEAQRTVVDYAFSSGNPAVWMHQIMAESGSGTPPWAQSAKQSHQQQQQQPQALRQTAASASGSGSGSAAQSPRHNRPAQPHPPQLSPRQQARPPPHQLNHHNHHNHHNQPQQHSAGGSRVGNNAGLTAAAAANHTHTHNQQQRLPTGLGPGVPRHTSAETLHLQSMSYLASKEACRTLAADSRPAVSINLREVLFDGYGSNNNDYITASNNNNSNSAGSPTGGGSATNRFGAGVFK